MRHLAMTVIAFALAFVSSAAYAGDGAPESLKQAKIAACDRQAAHRTGDERQVFVMKCLSSDDDGLQEKRTRCNVEAKGKLGNERRRILNECLKRAEG